jgi:tRNA uridine 5-carboxymethylaminomethyl modification enzyme
MPEEVQLQMLHTVAGLEKHAEMMRCAYAIEYDCVDPTELLPHAGVQKNARPLRRGAVQRLERL